jgi:DNA-binding response OmpR family regulator
MDLQMPEMGGIDAISAIRAEFPEARIIVLTTYVGDVQVVRAIKAGAQAYLLKGPLRKELIQTIRAAGQRRMSQEVASEIAEHAADDRLTARKSKCCVRLPAAMRTKRSRPGYPSPKKPPRAMSRVILTKLRANDRTHAVTIGLKARNHRIVTPRKRGR